MKFKNENGSVRWGVLLAALWMMLWVGKLLADTYTQTGIQNLMISNTTGNIVVPALNLRPLSTDPSNAQVGDIWYATDTGSLRTQGASKVLSLGPAIKSAIVASGTTITNPTANTSFSSTVTIPANTLVAGNVIRMRAFGTYTNGTGGGLFKFAGELGPSGQVLANTGNITPTVSGSNLCFSVEQTITIRTIGASGTKVASILGTLETSAVGGNTAKLGRLASSAIDTTVANILTLDVITSASDASAALTLEQMVVTIEN
jgi:hypothetical protein